MLLRTLAALLIALPVSAQPLNIADTDIIFEPPEGFERVPQEIIELKWPSLDPPTYVIGNENATTTVAYDLKPHTIHQSDLPQVQQVFQTMFERVIPGLEWKRNEIVELSGQSWLWMEMTSKAIDTDIYNIILLTGYEEEMLIFNFNSTKVDFPLYEDALRTSIESIQLP